MFIHQQQYASTYQSMTNRTDTSFALHGIKVKGWKLKCPSNVNFFFRLFFFFLFLLFDHPFWPVFCCLSLVPSVLGCVWLPAGLCCHVKALSRCPGYSHRSPPPGLTATGMMSCDFDLRQFPHWVSLGWAGKLKMQHWWDTGQLIRQVLKLKVHNDR